MFWKILLKEVKECVGTPGKVTRFSGSCCYSLSPCRFYRVICRQLCCEVGRDRWGGGRRWLGVRLYDSDMCIFGLYKSKFWLE
jgi:hypothetical protein